MTRVGAERTDVAPLWPAALIPPERRLIYLDLNQWIAMAKADVGHPDGRRLQAALEALRANRTGWTYAICMPLIAELTGIRNRRQRADLARMIEEFTDYACVMPLTTMAPLEFESALAAVAPITERFAPIPLVGNGVMQAFGMRGHLRVRDRAGRDVTDQARQQSRLGPEEFDRRLAQGELDLNRAVIRGPADDEEEARLRARGWNTSATREVAERRAQQEREQAARLATDPHWRRGRLRDLVATRYLELEVADILTDALAAHGLRTSELFDEPEQLRRFTDSMPTADVWVTLMTAKHRSADTVWKPNDIFDVDALSVAAAYCDVVVTERHAAHVLSTAGVPERLGTTVLTDLDQLAAHVTRPRLS
jgi:hypothetical protein